MLLHANVFLFLRVFRGGGVDTWLYTVAEKCQKTARIGDAFRKTIGAELCDEGGIKWKPAAVVHGSGRRPAD